MNPEFRNLLTLIVIAAAVVLAGCGNSYSSVSGQVAATVNGKEIAVRQVSLKGGSTASVAPDASDLEALDALIDQELLVQKALEMQLDRNPAVLLELEAAKHRILAKTYVDRSMRYVTVLPDEIAGFYREHPALFAQRRIFRFNELIASVGDEDLPELKNRLGQHQRFDELARWLQARNLPFRRGASIRASEQIRPDLLPKISIMKSEQIALFEINGEQAIVQLLQSQDAPLTLAEAKPAIEKHLLDQKRQAFSQAKAKQLRGQARINYQGLFAEAKNASPSTSTAENQPAAKDDARVIKGLAGLL